MRKIVNVVVNEKKRLTFAVPSTLCTARLAELATVALWSNISK